MKRVFPLGILLATVALDAAFLVAHVARGTSPSTDVMSIFSFGQSLAFILWVVADARARRQTPCFDFGFLVGAFFPASLVWYVVWSRGRRGMLLLAGFVGLMFLPMLTAVLAWVLRNGAG